MVIHHDKLAYGKIDSGSEQLSEDMLLKMLQELNAEEESPEKREEEGNKENTKNIK